MKHLRALALLACLGLTATFGSSCALFGWAVATLSPPPKIKPVYSIPKGKKILVFVDEALPIGYEPIKYDLATYTSELLVKNKVAGSTIDHIKVQDLLDSSHEKVEPQQAGRKLGADIVLHVRIEKFVLKEDENNPFYQPSLQVTVAVVDPVKGRLWPADQAGGHPMPEIELPPTDDPSPTVTMGLCRELAAQEAEAVAKLFYEHEGVPAGYKPEKN